jgi:uncharacterized protein
VLKTSRYNLSVPVKDGWILYNARTGASRVFAGTDAEEFVSVLCMFPATLDPTNFDPSLMADVVGSGFLIAPDFDEVSEVSRLYRKVREQSPITVTITLTDDCNLGCYYCFQKRGELYLTQERKEKILAHIKGLLNASKKRSLHIDWYGGEPMLNHVFLEELSSAIQDVCKQYEIRYSASMLTNGTIWPKNSSEFIANHKISRIQVSFDGCRDSHNKIRRYRGADTEGVDQFEAACNLVDALHHEVSVDVRFNVSPNNKDEILDFCQIAQERGWFANLSKVTLQLAKLSPYTREAEFIRKNQLSYHEFENIRDQIRQVVPEPFLDRTASLNRYPHPRTSVCSAMARDSIVIGADGNLYTCGLQVTEVERSVGRLNGASTNNQQYQLAWWRSFDPTLNSPCDECSFLPLCWGACPKLHLEGDRQALEEQSLFWRAMLPRRLAASFGLRLLNEFHFVESDQFKAKSHR